MDVLGSFSHSKNSDEQSYYVVLLFCDSLKKMQLDYTDKYSNLDGW